MYCLPLSFFDTIMREIREVCVWLYDFQTMKPALSELSHQIKQLGMRRIRTVFIQRTHFSMLSSNYAGKLRMTLGVLMEEKGFICLVFWLDCTR